MTLPGKAKTAVPLTAALLATLAASPQAQAQGTLIGTVSLQTPAIPAPLSTPSLPAPTPRPVSLPQPPSSTSTPPVRVPSVSTPSVSTPSLPSISTPSTPAPAPSAPAPKVHVSGTTSPAPSVNVSSSVTPSTSVNGPGSGSVAQASPTTAATRGASAPAPGSAASRQGSTLAARSAGGNEALRSLLALGAGAGGGPGSRPGRGAAGGAGPWRDGSGYGARAAAAQLSAFASSLARALSGLGQIGGSGPSGGAAVHTTRADRGAAPASSSAKDPLGLELPPQTGQAMMVALIALGALLLVGVLFRDELQQLLSRLTQRPHS